MPPQDNAGAPIIPAGTEKTVFGTNTFQAQQPQHGQGQPVAQAVAPIVQNAPTEGTTFAELAAKKGWKSPDDLAKAYANLESHNKTVEMTAADILRAVQEGGQPAASQQVVPQLPSVQGVPAANPDEAAIQIVRGIVNAETKPLKEQIELQNLFLAHPDAKDFANGIASAVKGNPGITWENAYKLAKYDAAQVNARSQGQAEAYQQIGQKQAVIAGSPSPQNTRTAPDIRSIIKDRSIPFSEVSKIVKEHLAGMQ